jgi:PIN domain nuclease of toxin-antitoxin system
MNILLDSHAFLWFVSGNTALSQPARNLIENVEHASSLVWQLFGKFLSNIH